MEVTKANFKESLELLRKLIPDASFLSVDGEFTGLNVATNFHGFDTPQERYKKIRKASVDFLLIQFGVSVFTYDKNKARYIAQPFNFYIFPRPMNSRHAPDKIFLCQSSSIDFLISQGFDFNKLFKEGIPYLMPVEENLLREQLQQKHAVASTSDDSFRKVAASPSLVSPPAKISNIPIPEEYKEFIENTCQKIKEFIEDKDAEKLELDPCNAFLRKLIYQTAKTKFPTGVFLDTQTSEKKVKYIAVAKVKEDEIKRKEEEKQKAEMDELEDAVAFSKVIKLICDSGKLVVGHNMLLDVLHIIHQFICEVPEELDDYKTVVRCMFPKLLDTKLMASTQPFKDLLINTALGELYQSLAGKPFKRPCIEIPSKFPNYKKETNLLHEAGYDAYITGICFITMANYLGTFQDPVKGRVSPNSSSIQPFMNKIFVMKMQDIPYINLTGPDLTPSRDHVFHITFPKEWKASDLYQLFSPFGSIYIAWIDDSSAFISLYKRDQADIVMKALKQGDYYFIQPYKDYKIFQNTGTPPAAAISSAPDKTPSRKRPHIEVDIHYPSEEDAKRAKILDASAPPFVSRRSISPIEEDPDIEVEDADENSNRDNEDNTRDTKTDDTDEKANKNIKIKTADEANIKSEENQESSNKEAEKLFEESDTW